MAGFSIASGLFNSLRNFVVGFKQTNLIPRRENNFDDDAIRLSRYPVFAAYVDNEVYSSTFLQSAAIKLRGNLYKNIRAIKNMTGRVVDLFVYYVYVGNIDLEHLTGGAIPIVTDDEKVRDAVRQAFTDSNWNIGKELLVRIGATYGDVAIKIVDDRSRQQVRMEVLDPGRIMDVELDDVGNVTMIAIEYERTEEINLENAQDGWTGRIGAILKRKAYIYTEIITETKYDSLGNVIKQGYFETFKDGKPFAYLNDMNGQPVSKWPNEYGFVPVVMAQHTKTGLKWGANCFYKVLHKIDELNDQASLLNDQVRKVVIPIVKLIGITKPKTNEASPLQFDSDKDNLSLLYLPKETNAEALTTDLDIAAVNGNLESAETEINNDLPILALQQIRANGTGDFTEPGINAAFSDAVGAVNGARANYDHATTQALLMVIRIGGYNGYKHYEGFNLDSDKTITLSIKNRAVISIALSTEQKVTLLSSISSMTPALQKLALQEMGFADDVIDEIIAAAEEQARQAVRAFAERTMGGNNPKNTISGKATKSVGAGSKPKQLPLPSGA